MVATWRLKTKREATHREQNEADIVDIQRLKMEPPVCVLKNFSVPFFPLPRGLRTRIFFHMTEGRKDADTRLLTDLSDLPMNK